ncbi:MAG TPA: 5'/3'-nucleotidase SurE [Ilumatobacteraceae bacterium]|jgi:5'-nucleotidase
MSTDVSPSRPLVLVTNDDGIESIGIRSLAVALESGGYDVVVAAPADNMSGAAAAIGPLDPRVPVRRAEVPGVSGASFAIAAPPAMIVIAAFNGAFGPKPMAVASGVNAGVNLGRAILHSGTVGAALTGHNLGLRAVAVSTQPGGDFDIAASWGVKVLHEIFASGSARLANVNVPRAVDASTRCIETRLASYGAVTAAMADDILDFRLTIEPEAFEEEGTDAVAVRDGLVSVSWLTGLAIEAPSPPVAEPTVELVTVRSE